MCVDIEPFKLFTAQPASNSIFHWLKSMENMPYTICLQNTVIFLFKMVEKCSLFFYVMILCLFVCKNFFSDMVG